MDKQLYIYIPISTSKICWRLKFYRLDDATACKINVCKVYVFLFVSCFLISKNVNVIQIKGSTELKCTCTIMMSNILVYNKDSNDNKLKYNSFKLYIANVFNI